MLTWDPDNEQKARNASIQSFIHSVIHSSFVDTTVCNLFHTWGWGEVGREPFAGMFAQDPGVPAFYHHHQPPHGEGTRARAKENKGAISKTASQVTLIKCTLDKVQDQSEVLSQI